FYVLVVEQTP
ncbi:hypothetical protein CP03DC29_0257B, partial [Chlamydia psittaci 03DC29]